MSVTKNDLLAALTQRVMISLMDAADYAKTALQMAKALPNPTEADHALINTIEAAFELIKQDAPPLVFSMQITTIGLATKEAMAKFKNETVARNLSSPLKSVREKSRIIEGLPPEDETTGMVN